MSADLLLWVNDPARALQKRLAEFTRRSLEEARQAQRTNAQLAHYAAYGKRHPDDTPPSAA